MRRFVAEDWPQKIWRSLIVAGWLLYLGTQLWPGLTRVLQDWKSLLLFAGVTAGTFVVACGFGFLLGALLISPIYALQASRNGAPFAPGDQVCILAGGAKGRVTRVYSTWQGSSVRVELEDAEREAFGDIYAAHQLQRVGPRAVVATEA